VNATLAKLVPGGVLWFSTNFRRFKLEREALRASQIEDLSRATLPEDFRDAKTRYAWRLVK
jgi:23S rRNA (guanine2445-N2)-methyltransferase / 23S rRNA (guanine2069-N7)-methyltransferase